jgi:hypothetical protein
MESLSHVLLPFSLLARLFLFGCTAFFVSARPRLHGIKFYGHDTHTRQRQSRQVCLCAIFCTIFLLVNFYFSLCLSGYMGSDLLLHPAPLALKVVMVISFDLMWWG